MPKLTAKLSALLVISLSCCLGLTRSFAADQVTADRVGLKAGKPAPFSGILVKDDYLAALVAEVDRLERELVIEQRSCDDRARIAVVAAREICKAQMQGERGMTLACDAQRARESKIYQDALNQCRPMSPWAGYLTTGLGVVAGAGICAASVAVAR